MVNFWNLLFSSDYENDGPLYPRLRFGEPLTTIQNEKSWLCRSGWFKYKSKNGYDSGYTRQPSLKSNMGIY